MKRFNATQSRSACIFAFVLTALLWLPERAAMADVDTLILQAVKGRKITLQKNNGDEVTGIIKVISKRAVIVEDDNGDMVKISRRSLAKVRIFKKRRRNRRNSRSNRRNSRDDRDARNSRDDRDSRSARDDRDSRNDRDDRDRSNKNNTRDTRNSRNTRDDRDDRRDSRDDNRNNSDSRRDDRRDDRRARDNRQNSRRAQRSPRASTSHYVRRPNINNKILLQQKFASARRLRNAGMAMTIIGLSIQAAGLIMAFSDPTPISVVAGTTVMQPLGGLTWLVGAPMWGVGASRMRRLRRQISASTAVAPAPNSYGAATMLSTH